MKAAQIPLAGTLCLCSWLTGGCSEPRTYERGWVGGSYLEANPSTWRSLFDRSYVLPALPEKVKDRQSGALFVSRVYENTPIMAAGVRDGDLILKLDGRAVQDLKAFYVAIDKLKPGTTVSLTTYRNGEMVERSVKIGKETYAKPGSFGIGIGIALPSLKLDLIPNDDFSILDVISYRKTLTLRPDLHAPEYTYLRTVKQEGESRGESQNHWGRWYPNWEGWKARIVILFLDVHKTVLTQEMAE